MVKPVRVDLYGNWSGGFAIGRFARTAFFRLVGMEFAGDGIRSEEAVSRELEGADCTDREHRMERRIDRPVLPAFAFAAQANLMDKF